MVAKETNHHVTTTKSFLAINRVIRATTTLQLGSPSDCQPCCHRNGLVIDFLCSDIFSFIAIVG